MPLENVNAFPGTAAWYVSLTEKTWETHTDNHTNTKHRYWVGNVPSSNS